MAKKAKPNAGLATKELREEFERRHENLMNDLESERSSYMNNCKDIRGDIKDLFAEAKERGIVLKPFKAHLKVKALEKKIEKVRDDLEPDDMSVFDYYHDDEVPAAKPANSKKREAEQQANRETLDEFDAEQPLQ
jgi:uncharacterized protein (UPF0335 family)